MLKKANQTFIAKKDKATGREQSIHDHLMEVSKMAGSFAEGFKLKKEAELLGYLHDLGKYSEGFQRRIDGADEIVDHSTAGAKEFTKRYDSELAVYGIVIAGHHTGLQNRGPVQSDTSYLGRLQNRIEDYSKGFDEINFSNKSFELQKLINIVAQDAKNAQEMGFKLQMQVRMLYSCLVDADALSSEAFIYAKERFHYEKLPVLLQQFLEHLDKLCSKKKEVMQNKLIYEKRNEILNQCLKGDKLQKGIYRFMVPTGAGKTISSMAFALKHGVVHTMKRIIYVIPYQSITTQTAKVFNDIFGVNNVLEHHSSFVLEKGLEELDEKVVLACDNWDMPIIVTTNVQFFESFFAHRSSKQRKLHNIAESVLIFDEVQQLPIDYLKPCMNLLEELVSDYGVSVLLCSATCPKFNAWKDVNYPSLVEDIPAIYKAFEKVKVKNLGSLEDDALLELLIQEENALCIVNTKEHAYILHKKLKGLMSEEGLYHLSTLLISEDRKNVIKEVKDRLKNGQECILISTSMVESGVDLDFKSVYRAIAGLDSIAQAAGRCNREGNEAIGKVYIFKPESEKGKSRDKEFLACISYTETVIREYPKDILSLSGINRFFELKYERLESLKLLDKKEILKEFSMDAYNIILNFRDVSERFRLIEEDEVSIIVKEEALIDLFKPNLERELQKYSVSIPRYLFNKLSTRHFKVKNGYVFLIDKDFYDKGTGLRVFDEDGSEALFSD